YLSLFLVYTPHTEIYTLSLHDALPISNVVARKCWKPRMCGTRKIKPHSPYTTDGTVASMSMRYPSQVANLRGAYSTTKIATPRAIGTAITRAMMLDSTVPKARTAMPNSGGSAS